MLGIRELESLVEKKENNNNVFFFYVKEVKNKEKKLSFKLYVNENNVEHEIKMYDYRANGMTLDEVSDFIKDFSQKNKNIKVKYSINALHEEYTDVLTFRLNSHIQERSEVIASVGVIKDIDEKKVNQLNAKQQKEFFIDLCCSGNSAPLDKLLNSSVISRKGREYNVSDAEDFNKFSIILGLERAASYGHMNIIKTILENKSAAKLIDFSNKESDLLFVLDWAMQKENKEIISYLLDEKQYKLNKDELAHLKRKPNSQMFTEFFESIEQSPIQKVVSKRDAIRAKLEKKNSESKLRV